MAENLGIDTGIMFLSCRRAEGDRRVWICYTHRVVTTSGFKAAILNFWHVFSHSNVGSCLVDYSAYNLIFSDYIKTIASFRSHFGLYHFIVRKEVQVQVTSVLTDAILISGQTVEPIVTQMVP